MTDHLSARLGATLLTVAAMLLAPVLGRLTTIGWERHREARRRTDLRQRLLAEVERTDWLDAVVDGGRVCTDGGRLVDGPVPRSVYEANTDALDALPAREAATVDGYYDTLAAAASRLEEYQAASGTRRTTIERDLRNRVLPTLAERRRAAEHVLREGLDQ